jgi:hypothetical protein
MDNQFNKHYTVDEARALLPQLRVWLAQLQQMQERIESCERRLSGRMTDGSDAGGSLVEELNRNLADFSAVFSELRKRQIFVKDLSRGLLDFPSQRKGKEVFLCWELDEEDIHFWHDIDTGYAGREKL